MTEKPTNESFLAQLSEVDSVIDGPPLASAVGMPTQSTLSPTMIPETGIGNSQLAGPHYANSNNHVSSYPAVQHPHVTPTYQSPNSNHGPSLHNSPSPVARNSMTNRTGGTPTHVRAIGPTNAQHTVQQTVTGNVKVQLMEIGVDEFKANVQYIQQQFPALSRRQVCDAFSKSNFDRQLAIDTLRREQERKEQPPPQLPLIVSRQSATPQTPQTPYQQQQQQQQQHRGVRDSRPSESSTASSTRATPTAASASRSRRSQASGGEDQSYKRVVSVDKEAEKALKQKLKSNVRSRVFQHGVKIPQGRETAEAVVRRVSDPPGSDGADGDQQSLAGASSSAEQEQLEAAPAASGTTSEEKQQEEKEKEEKEEEETKKVEEKEEEEEDGPVKAFRLLRESFPLLDDAKLSHCLQQCEYDVDAAIQLLSGGRTGARAGDSAKFFKSKQVSKEQVKKQYVRAELNSGPWMDKGGPRHQQQATGAARTIRSFAPPPKRRIKREQIVSDEEMSGLGDEDTSYNREKDYDSEDSDYENKHSVQSDEEKAAVLEFFNTAGTAELMHIPSVSKKKAEILAKLRPFSDFEDLVARLDGHRQFNSAVVQNGREVLHMRRTVVYLMNKCEVISKKLEARVAALLDSVTLESANSAGGITLQPAALNPDLRLKPYQMVGLNWLRLLHEESLSAILGDQMGLGKTIQIIAFLAQLLEEGDRGPHLIIVPSSTLANWEREIQKWCPQLQAVTYYGSMDERKAIRQEIYGGQMEFCILLTTYNIATGTLEDRAMMKNLDFEYAIFDEAHMLKNCQSRRYKVLMNFRAKRRILLTGTPLQNNLVELMSLLSFVVPDVFNASRQCADLLKKMFNLFTRPSTTSEETGPQSRSSYEMERIEHAKRLMRPFFLRRTKAQVLTQLPQKSEEVMLVPMTQRQRAEYEELVGSLRRRLESGGSRGEQDVAVNYILQLRKAANHCLLQRRVYSDSKLREMAKLMLQDPGHRRANQEYIFEDLAAMNDHEVHKTCLMYPVLRHLALDEADHLLQSGKLLALDTLLPRLRDDGHRVAVFSQFVMMLDLIEAFLKIRGFRFLRIDGSTPVAERQPLLDQFAEDTGILVFLLSTRAGGLGINLTSADTVIIHDIDFNPYNDKQAEDRCHRLGQEREVRVIRMLSEGSVEEGMHRIADDKLRLEKEVTGFKAAEAEEGEEGPGSDAGSDAGSDVGKRKRKAEESSGGGRNEEAEAPQLQGSELVGLLSECLGVTSASAAAAS